MINYIMTDTTCTLFIKDQGMLIIKRGSETLWAALQDAIKNNDEQKVLRIVAPIYSFSNSAFVYRNNTVYYNGQELHPVLVTRLMGQLRQGFDTTAMQAFVENLLQNPSNTAIEELYLFLEANAMPITEDGCFIALKRINEDFTDVYTSTMSNAIGTTVSMPRNTVDDRRDVTCSHGLHVCGPSYIPHYSGATIITVKVNPRDVVSVPNDYNNAKMRVCQYLVLSTIDIDQIQTLVQQD